jgi:hypothetical protein
MQCSGIRVKILIFFLEIEVFLTLTYTCIPAIIAIKIKQVKEEKVSVSLK